MVNAGTNGYPGNAFLPEETGEAEASPTSSAQRLLQPQLQEPPVVQVQSAPQPQPQGQAGAGAWTGVEGRDRQEQVMGWLKRWDGTGSTTLGVAHLTSCCALPLKGESRAAWFGFPSSRTPLSGSHGSP
jgi:hypothetical protein